MKNKWFEETFLPSLIKRMENNIKYRNSMILSEKQVDVCNRYMEEKEFLTDYGFNHWLEYNIEGYKITMEKKGRYTFLYCSKMVSSENKRKSELIQKHIDELEDELDIMYDQNNLIGIEELENEIDKLYDMKNSLLTIKNIK